MCLNEKLRLNIKVKSRNCELFVLKKNDFLRLSVNFKEFIENFLHRSLMVYLKYNEERKKIIENYESLMNGGDPRFNSGNINKDEEKENEFNSDEENKERGDSFSDITDDKIKKEDMKNNNKKLSKIGGSDIKGSFNSSNLNASLNNVILADNNNSSNDRFIKKIDKIIEFLQKNNVSFPNNEDNPKTLLEQLKKETNIIKKEQLVGKIENVLKKIYKFQ